MLPRRADLDVVGLATEPNVSSEEDQRTPTQKRAT